MADYNTSASVVLTVNGQQAKQMLSDLQKQSEELKKKMEAATDAGDTKSLKKYQTELRNVNRMMDQIKNSGQKVDSVLQRLDKATPKELNKALVELKRQLNGIERGTEAWNKHVAKIKQVKAQIAELNAEMKVQQTWTQRLASKFNEFGASIMAAAAGLTGLIMAGKKAVSEFAQMDEAMANTQKFTGMTAEQVRDLNEEFKNMDTRTTRDKLNELAQEAGRLGKTAKEDIMGYVQAADILNVALSDLGDGATQKIAKLSNIFGVEETEGTYNAMVKIGSVINVLSQNSTASKPYLVEFTNRLAGVGNQANMTVQQIVGLGAVLDANAQKVEASSTAIGQVLTRMYRDPEKYARVAGLEVEKFANLLKTDANEALLQFLEALKKAGGMDVLSPMFADMGENGSRVTTTLAALADKIDDVRWQQQNANKAFEEGTSVLHEYEIFNNTAQASIDKARKRIQELSIELGEKLMPIMAHVMTSGTFTLKLLNQLVDFIKEYWKVLAVLTATIIAYKVAVNASNIAMKTHHGLLVINQALQKAWTATVLLSKAAVAVLTGNVTKANAAMALLNRTMKLNPWAALVAGLTALMTALWALTSKTKELNEAELAINKSRLEAKKRVFEERQSIERLVDIAKDERLSLDDRKKAIDKLNDIIPDYNANLDVTSGKYTANKEALDKYLVSLAKMYELEGAREKLQDLGKRKADINVNLSEARKELVRADVEERITAENMAATRTPGTPSVGSNASSKKSVAEKKVEDFKSELKEVEELENQIFNAYGMDLQKEMVKSESVDDGVEGKPKDSVTPAKDRFEAEKAWREKAEAEARISYRTGEMDYIQYTQRMDVIAEEFYQKQLQHTDLSENEKLKIQADYLDAKAKREEDWQKATIEAENVSYAFRKSQLIQFYIDGQIEKETYDIHMEELEIEHQKQLVRLAKEGTKERAQAEQQLQNLLLAQMQKRKQEIEKLEAEYAKIKDSYFGLNESERQAGYDKEMAALEVVYNREVEAAQGNADELVRIEEAKQLAILAIKKKYGLIGEEEYKNSFEAGIAKSVEWLNSDGGKALTGAMSTVISGMSAIFSQLSSYIQAELEIQTAAIEKKYDTEVAKAEGNTYKVKKLEEKKEKELAAVKDEANKKMFAMQVIQAVAQTATNALNAYGSAAAVPVVGYILAPIAAAMAVAAGAIQIASIKKQQQAAAAQGYSEGGFTPKGPKDKEVGIVHAGEWVASQKLVNNPRTRPMIEALEYAQRTNTIGSISSSDVSRNITAPMMLAHGGASSQPNVVVNVPENSSSNEELSNALDKLNKRLEEPFVTINTVAGDYGSEQAKLKYDRLIKNKSPKFKK